MENPTEMTLHKEVEFGLDFIKTVLAKTQQFTPMAIGVNPIRHERYVFAIPWNTREEKYFIVNHLKKQAFALGITKWIFMSGIWVKVAHKDDKIDLDRPVSSYPDKKEGLMVSGHGLLEEAVTATCLFCRKNEEIIFEKDQWIPTKDNWQDNLWGDAFDMSWFKEGK